MKKLLAIITTIAMILSLSVPAFAVEITSTETGSNTATQTVTANYNPDYTVTIADSTNGTVIADPTTAKEGDTVTLTVTPDSGYELDTLTVTYGDNQSVDVAADNTFVMPAADVTVTATFKEQQVIPTNATITGVTISGVETNDEGAYVINPNSTVTITVSGTDFDKLDENNKVEVNGTAEALTTENDWTIDSTANTAAKQYAGTTFENGLTLRYTNDGGSTWTTVDISISYEIPEVISVDINWGDLKFTYSDDMNAWAADTTGGDKVTVTNNGNVTVNAAVAYASATGYEGITGNFDPASATLAAEAEQEFTLTLSGTPTGKLDDVTIGNVTVTITRKNLISDANAWTAAIAEGGDITLGDNIATGYSKLIDGTTLDLNGYTLSQNSGDYEFLSIEGNVTIKDNSNGNGKVVGKVANNRSGVYITTGSSANLTIEGGTFTDTKYGLMAYSGTVIINGGTFSGTSGAVFTYNRDTTVTINGGTFSGAFTTGTGEMNGTIIVRGGTFDFDPSTYVDTDNYAVTNNGNGTYTVSAK